MWIRNRRYGPRNRWLYQGRRYRVKQRPALLWVACGMLLAAAVAAAMYWGSAVLA